MQVRKLYVPSRFILEDNQLWKNRFHVKSGSSNRLYTVAQNKEKGHFGCDCPGWKGHRHCRHLKAMNLPCDEIPVREEIEIVPV